MDDGKSESRITLGIAIAIFLTVSIIGGVVLI